MSIVAQVCRIGNCTAVNSIDLV